MKQMLKIEMERALKGAAYYRNDNSYSAVCQSGAA